MTNPESRRRLVGGDVAESTLPGIGQLYDLQASKSATVAVVIHHSGSRDLYVPEQ